MAILNGKGIFLHLNEAIHCFLITSLMQELKSCTTLVIDFYV